MFSWFGKSGGKPDHPMSSMSEAKSLLADLPKDDNFLALDEVTSWLSSITDTPGFRSKLRISLTELLDETGQPFQADLLKNYLAAPHLQDFQGTHIWHGVHNFSKTLAAAYEACLAEWQAEEVIPSDRKEQVTQLCVRVLRALAEQLKLELMRYIDIRPALWEQMFRWYSFSESHLLAKNMVFAYPGHAVHTSPQRELVRALMLYESSTDSLAPDQIEVSFRIAGRMVSHFDFETERDASSEYFIDLSSPGAPQMPDSSIPVTPSMRFFSAAGALPKIDEIIKQHERGTINEERRFGSEFTPDGKLTVLKHLRVYWNMTQPHRLFERRGISALIEVAHGFRTISKLVTRVDLDQVAGLSNEDAGKLKAHAAMGVIEEEKVNFAPEIWSVVDLSVNGIGAMIPRAAGGWVKIGDLCGIKAQHAQGWWVGSVRRLHADEHGIMHAGLEVLTRKPLSVWLRILGKGTERVSNWETSSGSFQYDYLPAILLPDEHNSYVNAIMLLEAGSYSPDNIYEVMLGEKSREIQLTGLQAEGEDYELVSFRWLNQANK
jgi:hypothetical protein